MVLERNDLREVQRADTFEFRRVDIDVYAGLGKRGIVDSIAIAMYLKIRKRIGKRIGNQRIRFNHLNEAVRFFGVKTDSENKTDRLIALPIDLFKVPTLEIIWVGQFPLKTKRRSSM